MAKRTKSPEPEVESARKTVRRDVAPASARTRGSDAEAPATAEADPSRAAGAEAPATSAAPEDASSRQVRAATAPGPEAGGQDAAQAEGGSPEPAPAEPTAEPAEPAAAAEARPAAPPAPAAALAEPAPPPAASSAAEPAFEPLLPPDALPADLDPAAAAPPPGLAPPGDARSFRRLGAAGEEFVFIYRRTSHLVTRAGTVGTQGTWTSVQYPHSAAAAHAYAQECSRLVGEGFRDLR